MTSIIVAAKTDLAKNADEITKGLPGHITKDRFIRTAQTAISMTRNIEKLKNTRSLMLACSKAAADGLILDGREAALVIDHNGDAQYRPMMRGLLKLAYNSGQIRSLVVEVARKGDPFRYSPTDTDKPIQHEVNLEGERGEIFAVYAFAVLRDGGIVFDVMATADVNRIRDRSDAYKAFKAGKIKSTPWSTDWSEMARKTVFRRLSKYLPSSTELEQAVERIDEDYTFEAEAEPDGTISTPKPATKERGGAAARLKDITPTKAAPKPEPKPETEVEDFVDHDPDTGEILEGEIVNEDQQPMEDF